MVQAIYINSKGFQAIKDEQTMMITAKTWHSLLEDIPFHEAEQAFYEYARNEKWAPTPSDIVLYVAKARTPEAFISGEIAWEKVANAASKIGFYRQKEAFECFSPRTLRTVKIIGWEKICRSERPDIVRRDFISAYDNISASEQETLKLPMWNAVHLLPKYGEVKTTGEEDALF